MADLILIENVSNRYSENLFSSDSLISDATIITYNKNSVSGGYVLSEKDSFTGYSKALKASVYQDVTLGFGVDFDFRDALKHTAEIDGNYIFQTNFKITTENSSPSTLVDINVKMYVNTILTETFTKTIDLNSLELEKYYTLSQSFNLIEGDLVDFSFELIRPSIGIPNPNFTICFDGFKLENNTYNIGAVGIPSFYSLPKSNNTGYQSKVDVVNTQNLTALTDNLISFTGVDSENGGLVLMDSLGKITPLRLGDTLSLDFVFSFTTPVGSDDFLSVKFKVNSVIYRAQSFSILEPTGETNYASVSFNLPVEADFLTYGGEFYVNPNVDITISNRYLQCTRTHKGI